MSTEARTGSGRALGVGRKVCVCGGGGGGASCRSGPVCGRKLRERTGKWGGVGGIDQETYPYTS